MLAANPPHRRSLLCSLALASMEITFICHEIIHGPSVWRSKIGIGNLEASIHHDFNIVASLSKPLSGSALYVIFSIIAFLAD